MKKYFLFLIVFLSAFSCTEDVKFNTPAFQATKDNVFWRAVQAKATLYTGGNLVIEAYTATEIVTLNTSGITKGLYYIGTTAANTVTYEYKDPLTKENITFSSKFNVGNGEIEITEYDAVNKNVSGIFKCNLANINDNPLAGPTLNFQYGVFYKIPVSVK